MTFLPSHPPLPGVRSPLHLSGANGFVETTERLIQLGASVKVTDKRGFTPLLACAPNDNVATCLATILMEELKLTDVDVKTCLCSLGKPQLVRVPLSYSWFGVHSVPLSLSDQ